MGQGGNTIATSTDGVTWTGIGNKGPTIVGRGVKYGRDASGNNVWVAVGEGGGRLSTSLDGNTWTGKSVFSTNGYKVMFDPNTFFWIAVGVGGNSIATSNYPTVSWTGQGVNGTGLCVNGPASNYSNGSGLSGYVVGGYNSGSLFAYSTDGTTWQMSSGVSSSSSQLVAAGMGTIAYGNGIYVAGGIPTGSGNSFATSTNLNAWTGRGGSNLMSYVSQIAYGNGIFIAVGNGAGSGSTVMKSTDGITWTNLQDLYPGSGGRCVTYANGRWFVGGVGTYMYYSEDNGSTWTSISRSSFMYSNQTRSIAYGNGVFVSVGLGTSNSLAYTTDFGIYWQGRGMVLVGYGNDVKYNGGVWLASGGNNTSAGNILAKSLDNGVTWTSVAVYNTSYFTSLIGVQNVNGRWYINGRGNYYLAYSTTNNPTSISDFVMINTVSFASGSTYSLMFNYTKPKYIVGYDSPVGMRGSTNGLTWFDIVNQPFQKVLDVHWNGTLWVAVGGAHAATGPHTIGYSYDGIHWIGLGKTIFTRTGDSVIYSTVHNLWIAGGSCEGGGGNTIATSPDGINWTGRGSSVFTTICRQITLDGNSLVAAGQGGNVIANSTDGINWTGVNTSVFNTGGGFGVVGPSLPAGLTTTTVLSGFSIPTKTTADAAFTITPPTTNSNGAFTYTSSNTNVATIAGDVITLVGSGTSTITASQASTLSFTAASISATLTVTKVNPTITGFSVSAKTVGDAAFTLTDPTSNSAGTFTYTSSNTAVATVAGNTVTIVGAGSSTITATQAASATHSSGTITATLTVSQAAPTLSAFSFPIKSLGDAPFVPVSPTSNSDGAFTYASSNTAVATAAGNTITIVGMGSTTITATQASTTNYLSATITATLIVKEMPTLANFSIAGKTFGDSAFTLVQPTSNSAGSFTYSSSNTAVATVAINTVTIVGGGSATITATQASAGIYGVGTITATLTVEKAAATMTYFAPLTKTFGIPAFSLVAPTSNSNGAITYTSSNTAVATIAGANVTIVGAGNSTITATQATTSNYLSATITTTS